jgi:hypothetical protein
MSDMSIIKERLPSCLEKVREFISKHQNAAGWEVDIYAWPSVSKSGLRVAEVSLSNEKGGCAWMQSNIEGAAVCFFVERLALDYEEGGDDEDSKHEIEDSEWRLVIALFGE